MKNSYLTIALLAFSFGYSQTTDSTQVYKKRVLESTEIEFLSSYYKQDGEHSAVGGGVGSEELDDYTGTVVLSIPLNADDVLTIDAGFSAYTSASSSNINPFQSDGTVTGASRSGNWKKDDDDEYATSSPYGTPWAASTGASSKDVLTSLNVAYSHTSDDRNTITDIHGSVSKEYDYQSVGIGAGLARLFNKKNSEISLKASVYFDKWMPIYPTELHEYSKYGLDFQENGYFDGVKVYDQNGQQSTNYLPVSFREFGNPKRNSYSVSIGFSQVLTKKLQLSVFADILYQDGLLSTPYHRMYFADRANYYIGQLLYLPVYDTSQNKGIFHLADDVERLPGTRFKIPVGARLNYYAGEKMVIRTYYRFYADDWDLQAHTASIEIPYKLNDYFTVYPMYRFYTQKASRYFAPYEAHYSFEKYYTSDYDLSSFDSHQYGLGATYTDLLTKARLLKFGLKSIDFRYNHYQRNDNLEADIFSIAIKFVH